jgi:hypothetical protein
MTSELEGSRAPSLIEEHCRGRLEAWLKGHVRGATTDWVFEPNGHTTAPDYLLTLNGREFAVEVAAVMAYEQTGKKLLSERDIWNALYRLLKKTERECSEEQILAGAYRVGFEKGVPNLSKVQHDLGHAIKRYIANTHSDTAADDDVILVNGEVVCVIGKLHNQASYIGMTKAGGGWEAKAGAELCRTLRREVDDKSGKMQHILLPRILVLFDQFLLASPYIWLDCLRKYAPSTNFHTIFVVAQQSDYVLLSAEQSWGELSRESVYAQFGILDENSGTVE